MDMTAAIRRLTEGGIVAYPTETFYGLAVDATNSVAISALSRLKGRDPRNPFPLILPEIESLGDYVSSPPGYVNSLIERYWPGPLTLVLAAKDLPSDLAGPTGGIGFRVSSHPIASALVRAFGKPITATSANLSGHPPTNDPATVRAMWTSENILILDGGLSPGGPPSTVLDCTSAEKPTLLREGAISVEVGSFF